MCKPGCRTRGEERADRNLESAGRGVPHSQPSGLQQDSRGARWSARTGPCRDCPRRWPGGREWEASSCEEVGERDLSPRPRPLGGRGPRLAPGCHRCPGARSGTGIWRAAPGWSRPPAAHLGQSGGRGEASLLRPGRVACGLFSQLASVALQTRECLW